MSRVDATLSARRKSVTTSSTEGKVENSRGCCVYMLTIRMTRASEIESASSRSIRNAGSGITMITTTATSASGTTSSPVGTAPGAGRAVSAAVATG